MRIPSHQPSQPSPTPHTQPVIPPPKIYTELVPMRDEYRNLSAAYQEDPTPENKEALVSYMNQMETLISSYQATIYKQATQNGFPPGNKIPYGDPAGYAQAFQNAVQTFESDPQNASLTFANECFTQVTLSIP